jgi:hypothetical protein
MTYVRILDNLGDMLKSPFSHPLNIKVLPLMIMAHTSKRGSKRGQKGANLTPFWTPFWTTFWTTFGTIHGQIVGINGPHYLPTLGPKRVQIWSFRGPTLDFCITHFFRLFRGVQNWNTFFTTFVKIVKTQIS